MQTDNFLNDQRYFSCRNRRNILVILLIIRLKRSVINEKFRLILWIWCFFSRISSYQIMRFIIINFSHFLIHEAFENVIRGFQDFHMTAEILFQNNQFPLPAILLISFKFLIKNLRISLTKTINRLLNIPHHKAIMPN